MGSGEVWPAIPTPSNARNTVVEVKVRDLATYHEMFSQKRAEDGVLAREAGRRRERGRIASLIRDRMVWLIHWLFIWDWEALGRR